MAQFAASGVTTAVPTAARGPNIYSTATAHPKLLEVGVWNTTSTAMHVALSRASATGTKGNTITPVAIDDHDQVAVVTCTQTQTADATLGTVPARWGELGAAVGAGIIWTFPEPGLILDNATTAGAVISCPSGTGQQIAFYFHWRE